MGITRLNHAVLYVRDADRSVAFYEDVLGFRRIDIYGGGRLEGMAFLQAAQSTNDHDLALFSVGPDAGPTMAGRGTVGLYHLAWEVDTLDELDRVREKLQSAGALVGATDHGTTKSLYGKDPDGIEFEIAWVIPADLIDDQALAGRATLGHLDLEAEKQRYGATTRGGVGISTA
jgi:catechol 2,3-dioxygenase-like lactoylglutathione lyase family enzyme